MLRLVNVFILLLTFLAGHSQGLPLLNKESTVTFTIKNLGFAVTGSFTGMKGVVDFNFVKGGSFDITIDANSIDTGIDLRDKHLRKKEYLDIDHFPLMHFVSSSTEQKSGVWKIKGKLTIKGITKDIAFPFTIEEGRISYFKGKFKLNRRDFEVGGGSLSMADSLLVEVVIATQSDKVSN